MPVSSIRAGRLVSSTNELGVPVLSGVPTRGCRRGRSILRLPVDQGNAEARISSFRIKLNIEDKATQDAVTDAVIAAIRVFLDEMRWEDAPEIFADIRALKEFDIIRFATVSF